MSGIYLIEDKVRGGLYLAADAIPAYHICPVGATGFGSRSLNLSSG
jgi:hypothetical protein